MKENRLGLGKKGDIINDYRVDIQRQEKKAGHEKLHQLLTITVTKCIKVKT